MPIYRKQGRGRKTWRVVVWHRGKPIEHLVHGDKADAETHEARWRLELEATDLSSVRTAPTFFDFCATRYRAHAETHLKTRTWKNRRYQLRTLADEVGSLRLTAITTSVVELYQQKRSRAGIGAATVNDECKVLARVLSFARGQGVPCGAPKITRLKVRKSRAIKAWTQEEVGKLLVKVQELTPEILPLVVFLANTGCRRGEAIALRWEHVDLERRSVRIEASDEWSPKGEKWRDVPISDALLPWLRHKGADTVAVFPRPRAPGNANPKKPRSQTAPWAYWPQKWFDKARKAAKLTGGPHKLRHSYAAAFLASTPDLFLLGRVLGHSHGRVTELYSHLLPDHQARGLNAVSIAAPVSAAKHTAEQRWRKTMAKGMARRSSGT